eukprot:947151-Prymnesium_polylepis.2
MPPNSFPTGTLGAPASVEANRDVFPRFLPKKLDLFLIVGWAVVKEVSMWPSMPGRPSLREMKSPIMANRVIIGGVDGVRWRRSSRSPWRMYTYSVSLRLVMRV